MKLIDQIRTSIVNRLVASGFNRNNRSSRAPSADGTPSSDLEASQIAHDLAETSPTVESILRLFKLELTPDLDGDFRSVDGMSWSEYCGACDLVVGALWGDFDTS